MTAKFEGLQSSILNIHLIFFSILQIMQSIGTIEELRDCDLFGTIKQLFETAEGKGDLVYGEPKFHEIIRDDKNGLNYELKIVEALSVRPNNRAIEPGTTEKVNDNHVAEVLKKNPFLKPEVELTIIGDLLSKYRLILNKFPNTKYHFLLVTKEFEPQDSLLRPIELMIMRTILINLNSALKSQGHRFFSFFNSGPESGYSQYHKHIQFMMLPDNFEVYQDKVITNIDFFIPNDIMTGQSALICPEVSFKHSILKLDKIHEDDDENEDKLAMLYMYMIKRVMNIHKEFEIDGQASYNFMMMNDWMMVVPRRSAKYEDIWQNSLGFMGIFNAKNDEIKDKMLKLGFQKILEECGFQKESDEEKIVYNEYGY